MQPVLFLRINIDNNKPKLEPKWLYLCCKFGTGYRNAFERQLAGRPLSPTINKRRQKKRMGIAGHDFAGCWIFILEDALKAALFLEQL
jgi:hypothetical protein